MIFSHVGYCFVNVIEEFMFIYSSEFGSKYSFYRNLNEKQINGFCRADETGKDYFKIATESVSNRTLYYNFVLYE